MIFTTKNKELAIFGNTITDVKDKWDELKRKIDEHGGKLFGKNGALASLFSGKKSNNTLTPEVLSQFEEFKEKFNSSSLSAEALAEQMENVDQRIIDYAKNCKNGELTTEGFTNALKQQTIGAKAATVATKALSVAFNMLAYWGISLVINAAIQAVDALSNTLAEQKEKLEETKNTISGYESELNELQNKLAENQKKINEINANPLDIIDQNTLSTLESENAELKQQLETLKLIKAESEDLAELQTVQILENTATITGIEQLQKNLNEGKFFEDIPQINFSFLGFIHAMEEARKGNYGDAMKKGAGMLNPIGILDAFIPKKENEKSITEETEEQIEKVSSLREELQKLEKQRGSMDEDNYRDKKNSLTEQLTSQNSALIDNIKTLQTYKDTLDTTDPAQLEWINKIQEIEDAYTASMVKNQDYNTFDKIINSEAYSSSKNELVELASQGRLTAEVLDKNYHNLFVLFNELGLNIDDVIEKLKRMKEEGTISSSDNPSLPSFKEAWKSLDNTDNESLKDLKEDLLELAKQGKLTVAEFKKTTGANTWLKEIGISAEEAVKKINKLKEVSSADQLASMGSGIKSLSDNLATKKESPKKAIDYDTLAGMSDELKECTEAWKNYEKVMGTASSTYGKCREATNKLATAFINSNNFLAKLTNGTKDYYISQLQAMGISNAEAIVTAMLTQKHMEAAEAKQIESAKNEVLAITKNGVTNETLKEVSALLQQQGATKNVWYAIVDLIAQEQILANTSLGVDSKIEQLNILAETYYGAAAAASFMNQVQTSAEGALSSGEVVSPGQAWDNVTNTYKPKKFKAPKIPKVNIPTPTVSPTNYSTPKPSSSGDKGKSAKAKESKQEVDWISRVLDKLQSKVDILKAKFETLFSTGSKNNNLNKQIKQTTKLLKAQEKAASKYQKVADQFYKKNQKKFSKNGISLSMLKNGTYDIKSYKSGIAQLVQTYEGYYDKVQDSKKATWELVAAIKELSEQKLELYKEKRDTILENNEKKRSYQEAKYNNATTAKEKNAILDDEMATYNSGFVTANKTYNAAKKQRNKNGKSAKKSVTKSKKLSKDIKKQIKDLISKKKEIPDNLLKKVKKSDPKTYDMLVSYNNSVDSFADALKNRNMAKKSDNGAYQVYYNEAKKQRSQSGKSAKTAITKTKGLSKSVKKKIKSLIKKGKEIPDNLMKKVLAADKNTYVLLANYNDSVDFVAEALADKKLANEQNKTNIREAKIEKQQNLADEAEAKYNLNQQYEENAVSAKDKNKYETKSLKNLEEEYKHLIQIAKLEGDVTEKKRLQAELEAKRKESYQKQYDNIKAEYDNKTALNDADISIVKARIETLEAAGKTVSKSMYEGLMKMNSNRKEILLKDFADLQEAGKDFEYGSDAWYKWQTDLLAAGQGLEECTQETINLQKAINALDFKKFELKALQLDATKSHLEFLVDMLSHKDLTSKESGGLTDEGMATISLRFSGIENYKETIKNAQANLARLYAQHADGSDKLTEEEFLEKREEQLDIIRQSTEAIADEKDAILDLVENALELQIDSINELIEKKKKALATEKDLYEYQRKVAKQTKNIALIQKQIAALSGDKSEEARARIQKLQLSLEEAQEDLKDTEYDKWHSDQEDMLDNLADEVEDFWERVMDDLRKNLDASLGNIEKMIAENPEAVARALDELGLGDAMSVITTYNPDGTHTNKATDYDGNTYESTYDETGENVKNQFKIDKNPAEGIVESNEGVKGTLDEISNTSSDIKDEIMDMVHNGKGDKLPGKNSTDGKDLKDEIMDMVNSGKGDKLPSTGTWKPENTLGSGVEKNGTLKSNKNDNSLTAMVRKLLDSALHKPKTDAEKRRMESDPLLKYLSKNYSGRTISKANEAKLGAMLGIPVNKDNITEAKAKQIKNALKNAGFAKGGIAETIKTVTLENGDEGITTLQRGEAVLNKEQTEILQRLAERGLEPAEPQYKLTDEQIRHFQESVGLIDYSDIRPKFNIPASNTTNTSVNIGDVNIHLDGSGIKDMDSLFHELSAPTNRQRMQKCVLSDIKNPMQTVLGRF